MGPICQPLSVSLSPEGQRESAKPVQRLESVQRERIEALLVERDQCSERRIPLRERAGVQAHKRPRPRDVMCEALLTAHPFVLRKEVDLARRS